jgi:hypothetical protein
MFDCFEGFKKYAVPAENVADFLARYYKRSRYTGRGDEYAACLLKSYTEEFEKYGFCFISHHDSNTGEVTAFYGKGVR